MTVVEAVVSQWPTIVQRRVKWSECDPAGVVYTAVFADYVISAAELFYEVLFGMPPQEAKRTHHFGTPTRALAFDFQRSLRPDDVFLMTVTVEHLRERTYVLDITARTPGGDVVFVATLTPVCVIRTERKSIPIPDSLRAALLDYRAKCSVTGPDSVVKT